MGNELTTYDTIFEHPVELDPHDEALLKAISIFREVSLEGLPNDLVDRLVEVRTERLEMKARLMRQDPFALGGG